MKKHVLVLLLSLCIASGIGAAVLYSRIKGPGGSYQVLLMASGSMEPTMIKGNYILFDQSVNVSDIYAAPYNESGRSGDILVFRSTYTDELIAHRAVGKTVVSGQIFFITQGDHNLVPGPYSPTPASSVIGKVVGYNYPVYLLYVGFWALLLVALGAGIVSLLYCIISGERDRVREKEAKTKDVGSPGVPPTTERPASPADVKEVVKREEITRTQVIVKIRCRYCDTLYEETLDRCPHCGAKT